MARRRLLFIHTGGTLGMLPREQSGPLTPSHYAENVLPYVRGLEADVELEGVSVSNIDSSDMTPALWESIADAIAANLSRFDGFVVLHGTDTMAWTATALSFLLENLPRPVVLTGAQRPIAEPRTDARMNIIHSAICATMELPEVSVYFGNSLYRGNRCTKLSVESYQAFASPNLPPLLEMGVHVRHQTPPLRPRGLFNLRRGFSTDVAMLTLFPGLPARALSRIIEAGAEGVVLLGFGAGNLPLQGWPEAIREATDAGVPVVISSQCVYGGAELGDYANSAAPAEAGALSAGDMTREAALVKLMFLLGQGMDIAQVRAAWGASLAGEISLPG